MENKKILENGISILLNVLLITIFLTIFFFTFVCKLEKKIIENQIKYLVNNSFSFVQFLPQNVKKKLKTTVDSVNISESEELTESIIINNKKIIQKSITFVIVFACIVALIIGFAIKTKMISNDFSFVKLGANSLFLLSGVIIIEFIFANYITTDYISVRPDKIKIELLKKIKTVL